MGDRKKYMTWLVHGGAFIDEMRILIDRFDPDRDIDEWVEDIISENILGKRSRSWTAEIVKRYFLARFVTEESAYAWKSLKILCSQGVDFQSSVQSCIIIRQRSMISFMILSPWIYSNDITQAK